MSSGQTGSSEADSHWYWLSNLPGSRPQLLPGTPRISSPPGLSSGLSPRRCSACLCVDPEVSRSQCWKQRGCVWCLNKSYVCAKANRFVPDVPDIHPIKPSEPISNLHHKDSILSHSTAQVLHSELPQSRANCRFNKERTQQNAAVCRVVTIKAWAGRCVRAKSTLIHQGWKAQQKNMFFKTLPCNLVFSIYLLFSPSPLGLRQLWLQTNSGKLSLSIRSGPLNHASPWDCWRRRAKQRPPLVCLFSEVTSWTLSHPDEVCMHCQRHEMRTPKYFARVIMLSAQTILICKIIQMHCTNYSTYILLSSII